MMNILLIGAPGSGKSTQAICLAQRFGIPRIAAGALFREEVAAESSMGQKVKSFVEAGMLVPDDLVTPLVLQRLKQSDCAAGVVLDGYPRTVPQAEALRQLPFGIDFLVEVDLKTRSYDASKADGSIRVRDVSIIFNSIRPRLTGETT